MAFQPIDYAGNVLRAGEAGAAMRAKLETQNALAALQKGPDPEAMRKLYTFNPQLAMQVEDQMYQRGERQRANDSRNALAGILLNGGSPESSLRSPATASPGPQPFGPAPMPGESDAATGPVNTQPSAPKQQQPFRRGEGQYSEGGGDYEKAIRADPEAFLTFQGKRLDVTKKQFDNFVSLNNHAMQLLGAVHDQPTYDAAKQQALRLYSSFGHDASELIGGLPPQYSPETIRMLQLRGMDTSKQLAAIARENNIESQIEVREQRADEYERHNRAMEANTRRGQDRRTGPRARPPTPTTVIGRIMDKQARGEKLSGAEQQVLNDYRAGKKGGGKKQGRSDLIGPVYSKGGKRIQYSKGAGGYVDVATGERVN